MNVMRKEEAFIKSLVDFESMHKREEICFHEYDLRGLNADGDYFCVHCGEAYASHNNEKLVFQCAHCGGTNIESRVSVNPNDGFKMVQSPREFYHHTAGDFNENHCNDCESQTKLIVRKI